MVASFSESVFTVSEFQRRLENVRKTMAERGIDAALIHQPEHLYYLTGFPGPGAGYGINQVCVIPIDGEPITVIRRMEEQAFLRSSWAKERACWNDGESTTETLRRVLHEMNLETKQLGLEYDSWALTPARLHKIKTSLPNAAFVDFSNVLRFHRQQKSAEELHYIRRACSIAVKALRNGIAAIEPGKTEVDVQKTITTTLLEEGADPRGSLSIVTSGGNVRFVHASASARVLGKGDLVHMELAPAVQNYSGRIMRATCIGKPTEEQTRIAYTLEEAQSEAFSAMKPGVMAGDVDRILRDKITQSGIRGDWETPYDNISGYTLGIIMAPWTSDFSRSFLPEDKWLLEEGMVFHMYSFAQGISFSETVLITESGHELLTQFDRKLVERS
ncbi:aminopeptidase P family protein [SAR202 cluster bacterium AD-804-J14_MRT_500m]|nr:aminopeptidase P family protein [SAR202 cluster bacterium AD-804-J14_MRT_500m]